jgi:RNA polymerase sigma-70 factor (ECF subfamily)
MRDFHTLYARRLSAVCSRYILNCEDQKDVFQNALVSIFTHIGSFNYRGPGSLQAWATRIVVNEALTFLRQQHQQEWQELDDDIAEEQEADDPPLSDVPPEAVHRLIQQLPTGYRTVLNLYVFEALSHQEIARLLGIRERSSASQLSRAKSLLGRMIKEYLTQNHHPR